MPPPAPLFCLFELPYNFFAALSLVVPRSDVRHLSINVKGPIFVVGAVFDAIDALYECAILRILLRDHLLSRLQLPQHGLALNGSEANSSGSLVFGSSLHS